MANEALLSLNSFGNPKLVKGNEGTYYLLTRLLLLEPGTVQSHPNMGVGIVSRYRYATQEKFRDLQQDIQDQIATYLPQLVGVQVTVTYADKAFNIEINIDGTLYKYNYTSDSNELNTIMTL